MRFWDDKDANGNKLTDGRVCLVIRSEENPDMPEIRTYGKDREEVLDKLAKTAETAQGQIHRMRKAPSNPTPARSAVPATPSMPAADLVTAVADLSNPQKVVNAVKTVLRAGGVDVDAEQRVRALRAVADIAEKWERETPDYPKDPRNDRILMKMAANLAGGAHRVTREHLDAAFQEAQQNEMLHEPKPSSVIPATRVQPDGNPDSRTVRNATSYRRNELRSPEPAAAPPKESAKHERWRNILLKGTGKAFEEAMSELGFNEWVELQARQKTA